MDSTPLVTVDTNQAQQAFRVIVMPTATTVDSKPTTVSLAKKTVEQPYPHDKVSFPPCVILTHR